MPLNPRLCAHWLLGPILLAVASSCLATLGESETSIAQDQGRMGASFSRSRNDRYALYALSTADGVQVRQFVSPAGSVFAIAWDGPVLPDLQTLLGSHFTAYAEAQRQKGRGVRVRQAGLVIESGGMMRAFRGRAYLPDGLPAGVTVQDIQ